MSHIHKLPNGQELGIEQIVDKNSGFHNHTFEGKQTSTDEFGVGHTHMFEGEETSPPIQVEKSFWREKMDKQTKFFGGHVMEVKQEERNGVPVGLISGHIATFDVDRFNDQFIKGAFIESIQEHQAKRRQIRFKDHHGRTIGGFPIETVREDEKGLFGIAEVNLKVQQGYEAFSLAKQGVLSDFSIGFTSLDDEFSNGVRMIKKAMIWEGSIVDEPMNTAANVLEVKSVVSFQDLPLAARDREWDSSAAIARVRQFTNSEDAPSLSYRNAFIWFDSGAADQFGSYKLPVADVVDGRLVAVPRAIFAAAAALQGARGGVDIPDSDRARVIRHVERYYAKMDLDSPFDDEKSFFTVEDVKGMSARDLEKALRCTGGFSKDASKFLISKFVGESQEKLYTLEEASLLISLREMKKRL